MPNDEDRRNPRPNMYCAPPYFGSTFEPYNENEGERSANLEDTQANDNFEGAKSLTHPPKDDHQNIADIQPFRRSSKPSIFPRNFNDFIVDSKVNYSLEKNNTWELADLPEGRKANGFIKLSIILMVKLKDTKLY
ncbi:hypothetical protein Tco_1185475 [Tanacetum coccineum]